MKPKHKKAKIFFDSGLFDDLSTFREIEVAIDKLDSNLEKGDAFEVFTEALIATSPIFQAEQVWPFESIPSSIKKQLLIDTSRDMGIDGVYKKKSGDYITYQSKFRRNRKRLTWDELSTFIGLSDSVDSRLIFTNSLLLPDEILNQRTNIFCQRGSDLDSLDSRDFKKIHSWLSNSKVTENKKKPLEHQQEAIDGITNELAKSSRATAVMACGTGKSLVSLWVAEKLNAKSILILLPSLALVRQLLKEWCYESSWDEFPYICVCSDKTVANDIDGSNENTVDFCFPVTTDIESLSRYLNRPEGRKIVFSTYQSAKVVASAMNAEFRFDLGVFDEAHKTAGKEGKQFSFAIDDNNIHINKRLFLTATPKHYSVRKNSAHDETPVYSMENEAIYGKIAYKLTFSEAARREIICNYKVVISVTTNEDVNREAISRGDVEVGNNYVKAKQIANQLSIKECLEKYEVKKIFTFHKSIASAKSFTKDDSEGITQHIPYLKTYHVNGKIKAGARESIIAEFKDSEFALMSNSRCLTEGVDVPTVDMVAFLSPKRSQVDVIQATGRAMRKSDNKVVGYVLVPIYLQADEGETLADAVDASDFNEVFDVLNALQEQDEKLYSSLCALKENSKNTKGYIDDYFNDIVDITGPEIDLTEMKNAITTRVVNKLAPVWHERFSELKEYFDEFGDTDVPKDNKNKQLANWVKYQRQQYRVGVLPEDRIDKLEELDFKWNVFQANWNERYSELENFYNKNGTSNVPRDQDNSLYNWTRTQAKDNKSGNLSLDRVGLLNRLNFNWETREGGKAWDDKFEELKSYYSKHGTTLMPARTPSLGMWCVFQRQKYFNDELDIEQISKLNSIDFVWAPRDDGWDKRFNELRKFYNKHGHCRIPYNDDAYQALVGWIASQRSKYESYQLSSDPTLKQRVIKLDSINFDWTGSSSSTKDDRFLDMLTKLEEFEQVFGHTRVPARWAENQELGRWVEYQRRMFREEKLPDHKKELLDDYRFDFASYNYSHENTASNRAYHFTFEQRVSQINEYKDRFGTSVIPHRYTKNGLGYWINRQKKKYRDGKLEENQIKQLEEVGVEFNMISLDGDRDVHADLWNIRFEELELFKEKTGNCNVPGGWVENKALATWVKTQRFNFRNEKLTSERIELLDGIGFQFDAPKSTSNWDDRYTQLIEYKRSHGTVEISKDNDELKQLRNWSRNQIAKARKGTLDESKIQLLVDAGLDLSIKNTPAKWGERYNELLEFHRKNGHCDVPQLYGGVTGLGKWVNRQRQTYANGKLISDKVQLLDDINFIWKKKRGESPLPVADDENS